MTKEIGADRFHYQPLAEPILGLSTQQDEARQVYAEAFLLEWILISNYSADDFEYRFLWPELGPEVHSFFSSQAALGAM